MNEDGMKEDKTSVILTSMLKRVDEAAYNFLAEYLEKGKIETALFEFDIQNDGVGAELTKDRNLTDEEIAYVTEYYEKIKSGEITVSRDHLIPDQTAWKLSDTTK